MRPTILHRVYLLVVLCFTWWVGSFGFFWPKEMERALPWPVPALHARVIGALYLSATAFLLLALLSRTRLQGRTVIDIALVWTGWLLFVSIAHWNAFDPARVQVWFWATAYLTFPIVAAYLSWTNRTLAAARENAIGVRWIPLYLYGQGATLVVLALLLGLFPGVAVDLWPWKLSPFLAQVYSGPVLGFGIGSLLLAWRRNWPELLIPTIGMLVFATLALVGSYWHLALFAAGSLSKIVWFVALGFLAIMSAILIFNALRFTVGRRTGMAGEEIHDLH